MDNHTGHRRHLYLTNLLISLGYASAGCVFSWTSPTLPRLMEKDSWLPITEEQGSWIGSVISIGGTVGPLTSGTLLDKLGRKWTIVVSSFLLLISWVVLGLATCLEMVFLGRFIAGFAAGTLFMVLIIYIAETSDDTSRGMLSSTTELSLGLGFNLEYFAGPYLSYQHLIILSSILPVSFILMFIWLPETPYYLVSKGKTESAIKSLRWYRGNISLECAEKEIVIIESTMYEMMQKKQTFWDLMKIEGNRRALYITCFLMAAQQFSGINVLQLYSELIFMYSGTTMKPAYCAMTVGTFQLIGSLFAAPITKRFGYKKPLLITCIFISIEHFSLGLFFYFSKTGKDISSVDCMPVVCLVLYIVTYSATLGPLPWGVVGEIFPTNVKATASSFVTAVNFLTTFFVTKFFTNVSNYFGLYTSFWIFTASMIVSFFFILLVQPETKGMSLQDIQNKLNNRQTSSGSTT